MADSLARKLFSWKQMLGRGLFARAPRGLGADQEGKNAFLEAILGARAADFGNERAITELQFAWSVIAGPLAKHSHPVRIKGTRLHVRVEKSVHAQELSMHSSTLLREMHRRGHTELKRIQMEVGAMDWSSYYKPHAGEQNKGNPGQKNELDGSDITDSAATREMLEGLRVLKEKD